MGDHCCFLEPPPRSLHLPGSQELCLGLSSLPPSFSPPHPLLWAPEALYNYLSCPRLPHTLSWRFSLSLPQAEATGDTSSAVPGPTWRFANCQVSAASSLQAARWRGWAGGWAGGGEGFGVGVSLGVPEAEPGGASIPAPSLIPGFPLTPTPSAECGWGTGTHTCLVVDLGAPPICFLFRDLRRP